ncbi:uncharacterized protein LOC110691167 [Chenopodium quinoa]|uniref:uncharacterized protein LOC110691167 n=1 Tax=Chenopodium quinoa TaxID=63459 RepID=UPI000B79260B|nr:uncharacterized protein LOC110691167 [Chenopodium quinoa]
MTPTGTTPYRLVYGKSCHLSIKIEHRALWEIKKIKFYLESAGEKRWLDLHELEEFWLDAYYCDSVYKSHSKETHDKLIEKKEFCVGEKLLLYNSKMNLFPVKLISRWSGPDLVKNVFPSGVVEVSMMDYFPPFKVNGHRLKKYHEIGSKKIFNNFGVTSRFHEMDPTRQKKRARSSSSKPKHVVPPPLKVEET